MANLNTAIRGLQIRDAFFGDGLKRNGSDGDIAELDLKTEGGLKIDTAQLAVEPSDFAGAGLVDDGSDNLAVNVDDVNIEIGSGNVVQIKDASIGTNKLSVDVNASLGKADTALQAESDPVFTAWDKDYDDLTNKPTLVTAFTGLSDTPAEYVEADAGKGVRVNASYNGLEFYTITDVGIVDEDILVENFSAEIDESGYTGAHELAETPFANSVQVYLNGLMQEEGTGKDYILSGKDITFVTAPESGDILIVHYIKATV